MRENRAFDEMLRAALARLEGRDAEDIARASGIEFDGVRQVFVLESMGRRFEVSYPGFEVTPAPGQWHHLLMLHYMDMADGAPLTGELISFGALDGGMVRGGGFDRRAERELGLRFGNCPA